MDAREAEPVSVRVRSRERLRDEWREPWKARGARPIASVERPDRMEGLAIAESKPTYCGLCEEAP